MKITLVLTALLLTFSADRAHASLFRSQCTKHMECLVGKCDHIEKKPVKIEHKGSGNDGDLRTRLESAAELIYNDISKKLGLNIPNSVITHLSPSDMAALSSAAGHPAPHWIDGKAVMAGAVNAAGIYEFVVHGMEKHHQFVRDSNDFHESLIVYAHVAGHYDFSETTPFFRKRNADQIKTSLDLAQYMSSIKPNVDINEMNRWYHQLQTLQTLQDLSRGSHFDVSTFAPENNRKAKTIPSGPTESILQAFIANLPADILPWKREMAIKFEKSKNVTGAYLQTKYMNEGWATMMEYIVLRHSPWTTSADATAFAQINAGVVVPRLSNPYYTGLEAWRILYNKFLQNPMYAKLTEIQKDAEFIKYAHKIIASHTDYTFLRMALDSRWVEKNNLLIYKAEESWDQNTRQPVQQKRVITRDADRVVDNVATMLVNHDLHFPKIELHDLNLNKTGMVSLKHRVVEGIPLDPRSLAQALFAIAEIKGAPVRLETIAVESWGLFTPDPNVSRNPWHPIPPPNPFVYETMILEVSPDGKVKAEIPEGNEGASQRAQAYFQSRVNHFKGDLDFSYEARSKIENISQMSILAEQAPGVVNTLRRHAPTASEAVLDYLNFLKIRWAKMLKLAVTGKTPVGFDGNNVNIKIFPDIPEIRLDNNTLKKRKEWLSQNQELQVRLATMRAQDPEFADIMRLQPATTKIDLGFKKQAEPIRDEDLDIGQGSGRPGDIFDRKPKEQGGQGQGEKEPGDTKEGEQPGGIEGGQGKNDPSVEQMPLETWGKILAQEIGFRNLRRTTGENEKNDEILLGSEKRPNGEIQWDRTAIDAFAAAKAMEMIKRKTPGYKPKTSFELMRDGLKTLPEAEYSMRAREPEPEPDYDAVIVFVGDSSPSMVEEHRRIERLIVKNTVALLKAKHKNVKVHYVLYSTEAREVTEEEFFTIHLNGGTETLNGIKVAQDILRKYPRAKYNRYAQTFTDGFEGSPVDSVMTAAAELANMTEYMTYGSVVPNGHSEGNLSTLFKQWADREPKKVGYALLDSTPESIFDAIRRWFGKN